MGKTCTKCGVEKEVEFFSRKKSNKDGRHNWCKSCMNSNSQAWRKNNPAYHADYDAKHPEQTQKRRRRWIEANRDKSRAASKSWAAAHPDRIRDSCQRRRARLVNAPEQEPLGLTELIELYGDRCLYPDCDGTDLQIDHIVPLSKGGAHSGTNMQLLCSFHNASKGNRNSIDYRPLDSPASAC